MTKITEVGAAGITIWVDGETFGPTAQLGAKSELFNNSFTTVMFPNLAILNWLIMRW